MSEVPLWYARCQSAGVKHHNLTYVIGAVFVLFQEQTKSGLYGALRHSFGAGA